MTDFLLQALKKSKKYNDFDIDYALICAELANQVYNSPKRQTKFLTKYNFTDISFIENANARATIACYGNDLYIAIMGTDFSNTEDLENNADVTWTKEGKGYAHSGYKTHLTLIWSDIKKYIKMFPDKKVILCGHSMGGACGQIINYRLPKSIGYYFGSPRVVDKTIRKITKASVYNMQNKYDIVPDLPPDIFGFKLLGKVYTFKNRKLIEKPARWYNALYSVFCTLTYFFMKLYTKCFGGEDKLRDLILINHEIDDYILNLKKIMADNN